MWVIEVRPRRAWRGLRMVAGRGFVFAPTVKHGRASHFFAKTTVERLLRDARYRTGADVKPLVECPPERLAIRECTCSPLAFPPPRRKKTRP
jgi:hypothetical protein